MDIKQEDQEHFYTCATCGQPVDMRDLGQVFEHEHADLPKPPENVTSKRVGDPVQWTKDKKPINLN